MRSTHSKPATPASTASVRGKAPSGSAGGGGRREPPEIDEFGRDLSIVERFRPLANFLYDTYWRVGVRGQEHLPESGRVLIVANHSGALPYDGVMIHVAVERNTKNHRLTRFLVENFAYYLPYVGTFLNRVGGVRACRENAERLLASEEMLAVFPEGLKGIGKLYKERYQLTRFGRGGVIRLAMETQSPIIPCAVIGAEEIHPILWKIQPLAKLLGIPYIPITPTFPLLGPFGLVPLPSRWRIHFGKPMRYDDVDPAFVDDPFHIHALTEALRTTIQTMVDAGVQERDQLLEDEA